MSYRCILVGTDGSATANRAVEAAATMARQLGAELHIVSAYQRVVPLAGVHGLVAPPEPTEEYLAADCQEVADKAATAWGEGLAVQSHVVMGAPADAIVGTADEVGADLIVVGNKGMRGARRVLGSVPNSVAHHAGCSVLVVKTD